MANRQGQFLDINPQRPRDPLSPILEDHEELYEAICEFQNNDIVFFVIRCLTLFSCLIGILLVLVNLFRGNRLKSWRLYFLVAMSVFAWVAMTLYQDKVDDLCVQELLRSPETGSIYRCFRNFLHGFCLYLILLLLAHLSDMQHRCQWFGFIAAAIFVPLSYSVGLLIFDLRVRNQGEWINKEGIWTKEVQFQVKIAIDSVRVFLYNIVTTFLLFFMSKSFCTNRLYGTYSEKRSKVVVLVARWTFSFLLIHNLVTMTNFAFSIIIRLQVETGLDKFIIAHDILNEIELILVVLSVPMSYLMGIWAQCCCGIARGNDMEMDKVDKIYTDVWTTPSALNPSSRPVPVNNSSRPPSATPSSITSRPASAAAANTSTTSIGGPPTRPSSTGLQNGVVARRNHGSNSTLSSVDSIGSGPRGPGIATNPGGGGPDRRKRVRESYMEAVSMSGSMINDDRSSMTSEPIDL